MIRDLLIPVVLIAAVGTMMFPMTPAVMDFLLVINLVLALGLLITALYVGDSLKLSALPSMLLLATLFRLALNVSSTRLILARGEGGQMIEAFGRIAIQGNLVVGLTVFLIVTLIQFIVIAKGSERVAEVSARFTLDALPGKQMSIDADVRAGLIDFETARQKRQELQVESRFYGALDGAMKFIKGDAIAGMVIITVNVIGGFLVGLLIQGLSFSAALQKFTVLSIGEGLVSQIPALLNALAAGMVVTRVSRGNDDPLGREVLQQLLQLPHVRALIGGFALFMACMPGMPVFAFVTLGLLSAGSALLSWGNKRYRQAPAALPRFQPRAVPVLGIEIAREQLIGLGGMQLLGRGLEEFRAEVFSRWGVILAMPELSAAEGFSEGFRVRLRGTSISLVASPLQQGELIDALKAELLRLVDRHIAELVDDVLTRRTLDFYDKEAPELVAAVVPSIASVTQISELFKSLVREGISVKNLDLILQTIAEVRPKVGQSRLLLEEVRIALRRSICAAHVSSSNELTVVTIAPLVDLALTKAEHEGKSIDPRYIGMLADALSSMAAENSACSPVVLVSRGARRLLRACLTVRKVNLQVLCFDEIVDEVKVVPLARFDIPELSETPHSDTLGNDVQLDGGLADEESAALAA